MQMVRVSLNRFWLGQVTVPERWAVVLREIMQRLQCKRPVGGGIGKPLNWSALRPRRTQVPRPGLAAWVQVAEGSLEHSAEPQTFIACLSTDIAAREVARGPQHYRKARARSCDLASNSPTESLTVPTRPGSDMEGNDLKGGQRTAALRLRGKGQQP